MFFNTVIINQNLAGAELAPADLPKFTLAFAFGTSVDAAVCFAAFVTVPTVCFFG
jgi:hypothetical protein